MQTRSSCVLDMPRIRPDIMLNNNCFLKKAESKQIKQTIKKENKHDQNS